MAKDIADYGIQHLQFNQDSSCFIVSTSYGFRVFALQDDEGPAKQQLNRRFEQGGIGFGEMLFRCNYVGLIGGGKTPCFPTNRVIVFDDKAEKVVVELPFTSEAKAIKLRRDRIVVVLERRVHVYTFTAAPTLLYEFQTFENPKGLIALCPEDSNPILAGPGPESGQLQIINLNQTNEAPLIVAAHEGPLGALALNSDGSRVATASNKGTLIRVFDTNTGRKLNEVRRGTERATILCISFNADSTKLCCSSDRGTIHVFKLAEEEASSSSMLPQALKYFNSQWSFAKFSVSASRSICTFGKEPDTVIAVTDTGFVHTGRFDADGEVKVDAYPYIDVDDLAAQQHD
eukprot:TRINITY_DN11394_c0_g1_i1.p1 TRINITY_DN11394_c0_g1~~TRINITY_DN11394_c0_g1_i1.p1  ORF type:complete len:345 (+),score=74.20 TRINITY_DN11394_c0_g1_i1:124-1158(+)